MKFYTSYFYQIRFFPKNVIPISTAVWDPKWFHDFQPSDYIFKDKRGIYNGIKSYILSSIAVEPYCKECNHDKAQPCAFLREYRLYLDNLDFDFVLAECGRIGQKIKNLEGFEEEPEIAFIFYETPDNPCSERVPFISWFKDHGLDITEWTKDKEV